MSLNKVMLIGNIGKPPVYKKTPKGASICTFSVATNQYIGTKDGEAKQRTDWHSIEVYGKQADACSQYLASGSKVFVEGTLTSSTYKTKDGIEKTVARIISSAVTFLDGKNKSGQMPTPASLPASADEYGDLDDTLIV